ncbi:MAG: pseudouridine synthase [Syntrophomonas sp.]
MDDLRLAKYIAQAGITSRRKAEELIARGRVMVNGVVIREQGVQVEPEKDEIKVDGTAITQERSVYLLLNKPLGVICSMDDPQGRSTVAQLVERIDTRVFPVGRLDYDSEGLLLMTNDGDFANLITHPRFGVKKRYRVRVKGCVSREALQRLRKGVNLEDGMTSPAGVKVLASSAESSLLEMELGEGRKREVRRMCAAVGFPVVHLQRTALSFLSLQGVASGKFRYLTPGEVERLKKEAVANRSKKL